MLSADDTGYPGCLIFVHSTYGIIPLCGSAGYIFLTVQVGKTEEEQGVLFSDSICFAISHLGRWHRDISYFCFETLLLIGLLDSQRWGGADYKWQWYGGSDIAKLH